MENRSKKLELMDKIQALKYELSVLEWELKMIDYVENNLDPSIPSIPRQGLTHRIYEH